MIRFKICKSQMKRLKTRKQEDGIPMATCLVNSGTTVVFIVKIFFPYHANNRILCFLETFSLLTSLGCEG